jgi:hypothetical protein
VVRALPPGPKARSGGKFSEKPSIFAELIEAYFPNLPKIELTAGAGRGRAGMGWGGEVEPG